MGVIMQDYFSVMHDASEIYNKLLHSLKQLMKISSNYSNDLVSLGNEHSDSAELWRFIMTLYLDKDGYVRIKIKYFFPPHHAHRCHTKTLKRGTDLNGLRAYVHTMLLTRIEETYPEDCLKEFYSQIKI